MDKVAVPSAKKPTKYNKKDIEEYIKNGNSKIDELKEQLRTAKEDGIPLD